MARLNVNGKAYDIDVAPDTPLLWAIRENVGLTGTKYGCGIAQCGACTVLIDGVATRSCAFPASSAEGKQITTIEGLGSVDKPHPLQRAFIEEQAAQCGYCINGMIMSAKELLDRIPQPTEADVRDGLAANLCRCGTHGRIIRAVLRAARGMGKT